MRPFIAAALCAACAVALAPAPVVPATPGLAAVFARTSYAPGAVARLVVTSPVASLEVDAVAATPPPGVRAESIGREPALAPPRTVRLGPGTHALFVRIGDWPSGLYFFVVHAGGATAYAPVIVRPRVLGTADVAVVLPTYSWQAYNFTGGDTWYACRCVRTVDLARPYAGNGIPPHFAGYDRGFLEWLASERKRVDVLTDQDLARIANGAVLRRLYRLVVFSGHEEYVTAHEYDVTQRYRDLGGHLMFLSADNFFREVTVRGTAMTLVGRWRDLGRPEAALIGAQYVDWNHRVYRNRPYRVVGARELPWLFRGTRLHDGSLIRGDYGIEIDAVTRVSPPHTIVVAEIPHIFGDETAQMTYYRTARGAEVFAAGTMNLGGSAELPDVAALLRNLWAHMA